MHKSKNEIVMSIKKQFIKTKPVCKVTFSVEAKEAIQASVIGDFNNWNPEEGTLIKLKNGTFKGVFSIDKDASYEFNYIIVGAFVYVTDSVSFLCTEFSDNDIIAFPVSYRSIFLLYFIDTRSSLSQDVVLILLVISR